jgi:Type II secretory pathway, ATPase PulE/Tfp pilus assembly pathway, ATPase PilB
MDNLQSWAIANGLVLMAEAKAWTSDGTPFVRAVVREHASIDESSWLDCVIDLGLNTSVLFGSDTPLLPSRAHDPAMLEFQAEHNTVLIQDDPVLVFALVNPYEEIDVLAAAAARFPDDPVRCVIYSPHAFAKTSALLECTPEDHPDPILTPPREWASMLGAGFVYPRVSYIVNALWDSRIPVLSRTHCGTRLLRFKTTDEAVSFGVTTRRVWLVTPVPTRREVVEAVLQETGKEAVVCACTPDAFQKLYEDAKVALEDAPQRESGDGSLNVNSWGPLKPEEKLWHVILQKAISMRASDVHIEPQDKSARVRFRINGVMRMQSPLDMAQYVDVLRTFKLDSNMLPDETRRPQDGAHHYVYRGVRYDQRYSTMPTSSGLETGVCRIFNSQVLRLEKLGLSLHEMRALRWALGREIGMIIVSGPTGSGKTTTLYALLSELNSPERKLFTVEEPVEKHFPDAVQIGVNPENDWGWERALKHILRQDPDVLLVGELRDRDSAKVAIQAALTGHKVLTTTHANDATGAILRLTGSFDIDPVALRNCLVLSIAQRLVPRLCIYCRQLRQPTSDDYANFPAVKVATPRIGEPKGCEACRFTGFLGQHLVAEFLPIDRAVSAMMVEEQGLEKIREYNASRGFRSLIHRATALMLNGEITAADAASFLEDLPL